MESVNPEILFPTVYNRLINHRLSLTKIRSYLLCLIPDSETKHNDNLFVETRTTEEHTDMESEAPPLECGSRYVLVHNDGDKNNDDPINLVFGCFNCYRDCGTTNYVQFLHQQGKGVFSIVRDKFFQFNGINGRKYYMNIIEFAMHELGVKDQSSQRIENRK